MKTTYIALLLLTACSCGGYSENFHGLHVEMRTQTDLTSGDWQPRLEKALDASLKLWDMDWKDLEGWRVIFKSGDIFCNEASHDNDGCTDWFNKTITIKVAWEGGEYVCFLATALPHELGHVRNALDLWHHDRRFKKADNEVSNYNDCKTGVIP